MDMGLLMDKDVQMLFLTSFILLMLAILNRYFFKYKEGWRFWVGISLISMALSGTILGISGYGLASFLAGLTWVMIGLALWLIKAKKKTK